MEQIAPHTLRAPKILRCRTLHPCNLRPIFCAPHLAPSCFVPHTLRSIIFVPIFYALHFAPHILRFHTLRLHAEFYAHTLRP